MQHSHPSVATSALECYQQLLKTPLPGFIRVVLTPGSITTSSLAKAYEATIAEQEGNISSVGSLRGILVLKLILHMDQLVACTSVYLLRSVLFCYF